MTGSQADAAELLWLATRGGARAMNRADQVGLLAPGYEADMVAITPPRAYRDAHDLCDALVFHEDHDGVQEVRVRGQVRWSARA
jgi:guanine deaminase